MLTYHSLIHSNWHAGSSEYDEWANHRQTWKHESASIIEPPINFIVSSHSEGKKRWVVLSRFTIYIMFNTSYDLHLHSGSVFAYRPRWALIDKAYMHCTWRSSQSNYHLFRTSGNISASEHVVLLMNDLLNLCLHSYETVRLWVSSSNLLIHHILAHHLAQYSA